MWGIALRQTQVRNLKQNELMQIMYLSIIMITILHTNNRFISVSNVGNCLRAQNHVQWQITNRQKLLALSSLDEGFN